MTIPILKPDNLIHYTCTVYSSKPAKIVYAFFKKNYRFITCKNSTKHFQPELFDDSDCNNIYILVDKINCNYCYQVNFIYI